MCDKEKTMHLQTYTVLLASVPSTSATTSESVRVLHMSLKGKQEQGQYIYANSPSNHMSLHVKKKRKKKEIYSKTEEGSGSNKYKIQYYS